VYAAGGFLMDDPLVYFVVAIVALAAFQLVDLRKVK
jgi:hypothetical protein